MNLLYFFFKDSLIAFIPKKPNHSRSTSRSAIAASPTSYFSRRYAVSASVAQEDAETIVFPREGPGVSYGLNWALAGRGVIVKDKAFYNLKSPELQQKGGSSAESLSGLPLHVRGDLVGSSSKISKAEFSKLLKQVCINLVLVSFYCIFSVSIH